MTDLDHTLDYNNLPPITADDFYVVAKEPGAEHPALPTWANDIINPVGLALEYQKPIERIDVPSVPGAFQLLNVLSQTECDRFIQQTEALGYLEDAAVSLPRSVRHNHNVTWVVDEKTDGIIWQRCKPFMTDEKGIFDHKKALGLNARFRFYRYQPGDFFKPHTDGSWPGSRVIERELFSNAFDDRWSNMSFLIYLSDNFTGGNTQFWVNRDNPSLPARQGDNSALINIRTPAGGVLCFPHGQHPLHCLHSSEPILSGVKYIIRSDLLFEL